ncbi:acyl-coenzyme A thioesterase 9, mitochondrial [Drosophila mojavensis]|uniref:HotDog ACOT-type domain-containing protein n=1 Tax=Drosophila mojavensis TaxID=7230 RepID=B4K7Y8_DROMO|nr:acyl-coenzyme A thioesterase 9, mitochondrial [Drosophila mojavensis]EDW14322.2 uncharacterized protein Dmoj_GI23399 [Drosophila mojavensis]
MTRLSLWTPRRWQYLIRIQARWPLHCARRHYYMDEYMKEQSDHNSGTIHDIVIKLRERTGVDIGYHITPKSRENLLKYQPKQEELPTRSMKDSYTVVTVPLYGNELIRERYVNHLGRVRLGRLMEDMDMFAVWICHRHIQLPNLPKNVFLPYTFVTILVDRVDFKNTEYLALNKNLELSGFVSWTGSSSMEITIYVRQPVDGEYVNVTKALFIMVARNATNTGSAPANTLKPADKMEQKYWEAANKRQIERKRARGESVFISPPLEHEQAIMYNVLQRTTPPNTFELNKRILPHRCRWMKDSMCSTLLKPYPQNRNAQNTVFGGYLMRQAVELTVVMASVYVGDAPRLKCISDISFLKPVMVTDFLQMNAHVVYTSHNYLQLMTIAQNFNTDRREHTTTNIFYITFKADTIVDEVLPGSYREMLWYIHGRRKFLSALNLQMQYPLPEEECGDDDEDQEDDQPCQQESPAK